MFNWFHRLGSPKTFFEISERWQNPLTMFSVLMLISGAIWALVFVPQDYQQGNSVRILYIHVPVAHLAQSGYVMMAGFAAIFLIWRIKLADLAVKCVAPLGASITFLALVTGAIWGKPTWGTWWVWDARLTSTLVLFFLYLGMVALRSAMGRRAGAGKACSILALVGVVNLPVIKFSVEWWYTLHQPASFSLSEKPSMPVEMWLPLVFMVIAFYCFFFATWMMRVRNEILIKERNTDWVKQWLKRR